MGLDGAAGVMAREPSSGARVLGQAGVDMRLVGMDIKGDGLDPAIVEGVSESVLVDERSARDVHEPRSGTEASEAGAVDKAAGAARSAEDDAGALGGEEVEGGFGGWEGLEVCEPAEQVWVFAAFHDSERFE